MPYRYVVEVCVCVRACVQGVAASVIINHFENNPERIGICRARWEKLAWLLALNDIVRPCFPLESVSSNLQCTAFIDMSNSFRILCILSETLQAKLISAIMDGLNTF
jgi:hypothetical protein